MNLHKYSKEIQSIYNFFDMFRYDSYKHVYANINHKDICANVNYEDRTINTLPIELQEDLVKNNSYWIHVIEYHTFNMWRSLLHEDLKWIQFLDNRSCKKYNCYNEILELYKFLKI